jgi:hypothetical protein
VHKTERFLKIVAENSYHPNGKDYGSTTATSIKSSSGFPSPWPHGHASKRWSASSRWVDDVLGEAALLFGHRKLRRLRPQ